MEPKCTAPSRGHDTAQGVLSCPVHGLAALRASADEATLSRFMPPGSKPQWRDVLELAEQEPAALFVLASSDQTSLRRMAATHSNATAELRMMLAKDEEAEVRHSVAASPFCEPAVLMVLAEDESPGVRRQVAYNDKVPPMIVDELLVDPDPDVQTAAAISHNVTPSALVDAAERHYFVRVAAARNPQCPDNYLARLVREVQESDTDGDQILSAAASNPRAGDAETSVAIRERMRDDPFAFRAMLYATVNNHQSDPEALVRIASSQVPPTVITKAVKHPRFPLSAIPFVMRDSNTMEVYSAAMGRVVAHFESQLGVSRRNTEAHRALMGQSQWWTLERDSDVVALVLAMNPNP